MIVLLFDFYKGIDSDIKIMIAQEVQLIKVDPAIIARAQKVALKNYKAANWLKVISMHLENQNHDQIDKIVRNIVHQYFIMQDGFWSNEVKRKLEKESFTHDDADYLMMALQDGPYFTVARQIANQAVKEYIKDKKKLNFALSILEKIINLFNHDKKNGSIFYQQLRCIYEASNNPKKIRQSFQRQIKQSFDDVDLTYDAYKLWEPNSQNLSRIKQIYEDSKKRWQEQTIDFDEQKLSKLNIRRSLLQLEYKSVIDQKLFIEWTELLPSENDKLWFLRRVALNYKQMIPYYLTKCEKVYSQDQDKLIIKYKVAIRLTQNSQEIQQKYISFLTRRINKHLLNEQLDEQYSKQWVNKVSFFRQQINDIITKQRSLTVQAQQKLFNRFYKLWIQIEQNIIKDKDMVCKLYQNLLKNKNEKEEINYYKEYARSLIHMSAYKEAKNILKRCHISANSKQSRDLMHQFIGLYGNVEDQIRMNAQEKIQIQKKAASMAVSKPQIQKTESYSKNQTQVAQKSSIQLDQNEPQKKQLKRQRNKDLDQVEQKIQNSLRKIVHVDGQNTIFMKGIPENWSQSDVLKSLKLQNRVNSVRLVVKNGMQKDYCYIQFDSKEAAEQEIRTNESGFKLNISRPPADYDQTKTLFICALPPTTTSEKIINLFINHSKNIIDVRLKLQKDKNYAYVDFDSKQNKQLAYNDLHDKNPLIEGKKILIQFCDSNRQRNKKFSQVVFLKNLAFKARQKDIEKFFKDKKITNISLPKTSQGQTKGFGYIQFEKFKDYQQALDMRKGIVFGRQFQILKSDRQITQSNPNRSENRQMKQKNSQPRISSQKTPNRQHNKKAESQRAKDNSYFSNLFK